VSPAIPNRPVFRPQEVCDIAELQPYILRSWEAEFPDLGVAKTANGPRVYRKADVERVLRLKHLILVDGLTLAGARKQLSAEGLAQPDAEETVSDADVAAMVDQQMRGNLMDVRRGLQWILGVLNGDGVAPEDFVLVAEPSAGRPARARAKAPVRKPHVAARAAKKGMKAKRR
jgi:DNA-binding transcriptional MerR regulator